jgi:hypothetical protein
MEVKCPHLECDHWPSIAKVKNNKYVLHEMHMDNIDFTPFAMQAKSHASWESLSLSLFTASRLVLRYI